MKSNTKRVQIAPTWTRGTRNRMRRIPLRYQDDELRVFRSLSKLSRKAIANYIDRLLGPR